MEIHKKLNRKLIIWGIPCLICLLIICYGLFHYFEKSKYNNLPYEKVKFSNTKYPKEQQKALKILTKEEELEELYKNASKDSELNEEYVDKHFRVHLDDLFISKIDLNNDKILDVMVLNAHASFSGTLGQSTVFYIIDKNSNWKNVLSDVTHGDIAIFKKNFGYRNIGIVHICYTNNEKQGISLFKWDGKEYQFCGGQTLTKQDQEVFKHE